MTYPGPYDTPPIASAIIFVSAICRKTNGLSAPSSAFCFWVASPSTPSATAIFR